MTDASSQTAPRPKPGPLALRACTVGLGIAALPLVGALVSGLLPVRLDWYVILGFLVAGVAGSLGMVVQTFFSTVPPGHPQLTQRYLAGMVGNFLLQVLAVAVGCLVLVGFEVKFAATAAFALAFAVTATMLHTAGVVVVSRALLDAPPPGVSSPAAGSAPERAPAPEATR